MEFPWKIGESLTLNRLPFRLYEVNQKKLKKRIECIESKKGEADVKNYAILSYV